MDIHARILVVDDESTARRATEAALVRQSSWQIRSASTLADAHGLVTSWLPSLVILDLELPGESGELWLSRQLSTIPDLAVIVVTGHDDAETALRLMRIGARDFLVKPVLPQRLRLAVERALGVPVQAAVPMAITETSEGAIVWPTVLPTLASCTASLVAEALRRSDGNAAAAARQLGVSRQAMSKRIRRRR
jgi:DNA-binding NtrC family response regulator